MSYACPSPIEVVSRVCQSFVVDNGAFTAWRQGEPIQDWSGYYEWADRWTMHPACDFAIIPDVIDGSESDNDDLIDQWPLPTHCGVPVWHMHESMGRLVSLATNFPKVALGSSGSYATVGTPEWWDKAKEAFAALSKFPRTKVHGLRMLNPRVFSRLPLHSADSVNVGRNCGAKAKSEKTTARVAAVLLASRVECHNSSERFLGPEGAAVNESLWDLT